MSFPALVNRLIFTAKALALFSSTFPSTASATFQSSRFGRPVDMSSASAPGNAASLHSSQDANSAMTSPVIVRPTTPNPSQNPVGSAKFIDRIQARVQAKQPFFSFEYFPPKTADGLTNLYMRFDRMGSLGPVRVASLHSSSPPSSSLLLPWACVHSV